MENLEEYLEVHFDIAEFITEHLSLYGSDDNWSIILKRYEEQGRGGMYQLAQEWTDIFMRDYDGINWGEEVEYYDVMEMFLKDKNNE